jgi:putative addiction module component (TIGR02574 family)
MNLFEEEAMPATLESLGIDRMSVDDRLALIQAIWDSLATEPLPLSDALRAELDRRVAEHRANPDDVVPWEQARAEALARLKR